MAVKIYTKTGDDGTTGLFGGERVPKYALRIESYGTVDELNSALGFARAAAGEELAPILHIIQIDLFVLGADLATPLDLKTTYSIPRIEESDVHRLESWIDEQEALLPPLKQFILPGGSELATRLHLARSICRRAERLLVHLQSEQQLSEHDIVYLNRLSDLLFVLARTANRLAGVADIEWNGKRA